MTPESFAAFYALYPRHVARKAAEKAWAKVATSEALIEQIMAGLRAQLPEMLKTYKRDRSMVPHPATWLNGHRFEDELSNNPLQLKRVIACEKCADTGVYVEPLTIARALGHTQRITRCSCRIGQLPGVLAGVEESA